jgi:predicted NAD/FAD-binding protein
MFIDRLIVPQAAAVWSADPAQMWTFPARFLAEFFDHHGMLGLRGRPRWRTVAGGSHRYVDALTRPWRDRLRLNTPVRAVRRLADRVEITFAGGHRDEFDAVVFAVHADQALALLADPSPREHELLSAFPYQPNEAVLHTDTALLPRRRRAWASWNYHLLDEPPGRATVTIT